jgi:large subunit ribosomal protein L13
MKTLSAKPAEVQHDWYVVDASGKTLGRLATEIARRLRGKHKTSYTPHVDTGDYIVVINAEEIQVTGKKALDKKYYRHTGFPGGIRETNFEKLIAHKPEAVLEKAVKGMLPKGPLGYAMIKKMKVYAGTSIHTLLNSHKFWTSKGYSTWLLIMVQVAVRPQLHVFSCQLVQVNS